MPYRDLAWAVVAARIIKEKHLDTQEHDRLSVMLEALTSQPPPDSWSAVLQTERPSRQQIKRALDKLLNAIGRLDSQTLSSQPAIKARLDIHHELVLASLMRIGGSIDAALVGYQHALDAAGRYHLTDYCITAASALRQMAVANNELREYRRYCSLIERLRSARIAEIDAGSIEDEAHLSLYSYHRDPEKVDAQLRAMIARLEDLASEHDSVPVMRSYYRVSLWHASIIADSRRMLDSIDSFEEWIAVHPEISIPADRIEIQSVRMSAYFLNANYKAASRSWARAQDALRPGTQNWAALLQLYFLVCTQSHRFADARDLIHEYDQYQTRKLPPWRRQELEVYRAYIHLLIDHGVVDPGPFAEHHGTYIARLEKNSTDLVRDKPIMNTALLVLRVFQLLKNRKRGELVELTESLRTYATKYLRNRHTQRTGRFLRLLTSLPACDFKRDLVLRRMHELKLKYPLADADKRDDGEIIPYDTLEHILLTKLLK